MKQNQKTQQNTSIIPPEEREIFAVMKASENGHEMRVTARESRQDETSVMDIARKEEPGDVSITFNRNTVLRLLKEESLDPKIGATLIKMFDDQEQLSAYLKSEKCNISAIDQDSMLLNLIQKDKEEAPKALSAMRHLIAIRDLIQEQSKIDQILFKKNVNQQKSFGAPSVIADRLPYLNPLLAIANLHVPNDATGKYVVIATLTEKNLGTIGLEHTLQLSNHKTPNDNFLSFIEDMRGDALKVFLSYWAYANTVGSFKFYGKLTDIMSATLDDTRKSTFSTTEKQRFWTLSKLLESTKFTIMFKLNNEWITVKHHMLDFSITTSDTKNQETSNGYPTKVQVRVLNPEDFQERATLATEISKGTLKLKPEDIMLALTIQVRASQRRNFESSSYDEEYLIEQAGLQKTYKSNPRMARKRLRDKLERLKNADALKNHAKKANIYKIETKTTKTFSK